MDFSLSLLGFQDALAEFVDAFEALLHARSNGHVHREIRSTPGGSIATITAKVVLSDVAEPTIWHFVRGRSPKHICVTVESAAESERLDALWHELSRVSLDSTTWEPYWDRRFYGRPLLKPFFVPGQWYCLPAPETMAGDMLTERCVAIDVAVPAVSMHHAKMISRRRQPHEEVAALVAFVCEVGLRRPASQRVWTYKLGDAHSELRQAGCVLPSLPLNASGEPAVQDEQDELNTMVRNAWALANQLSPRDRQRFVRALDALRTGLVLRGDLNLAHAAGAHVAIAVEALSGKDSLQEFTEFLVRYAGPSLPPEFSAHLSEQAKDYYRWVRSTYVHGRKSYVEENDPFTRMDQLVVGSRILDEITFPAIVCTAVVGWLAERASRGAQG